MSIKIEYYRQIKFMKRFKFFYILIPLFIAIIICYNIFQGVFKERNKIGSKYYFIRYKQ